MTAFDRRTFLATSAGAAPAAVTPAPKAEAPRYTPGSTVNLST